VNLKDFTRFRTALEITATSEHDGEVLAAIRLANQLLKKDGKTWTQLLQGKLNAVPDDKSYAAYAGSSADDSEIADMLRDLDKSVSHTSPFREFVDRLQRYWDTHGHLTDAQLTALRRAHENRRQPVRPDGGRPNRWKR
jgi:hypothetical protein